MYTNNYFNNDKSNNNEKQIPCYDKIFKLPYHTCCKPKTVSHLNIKECCDIVK